MSGDRGACGACQADLSPENSSKLRSGKVVHVGCLGGVSESRLSLTPAEPAKAEVPVSHPADIAPIAQPRKGRRMSIGGGAPVVVGVDMGATSETAVAFVAADGRLLSSGVVRRPKGDDFEVLGPRDIFAGAFGSKPVVGGGCSEEVRQAIAADPALKAKVEATGLAAQLLPKPVAGQRTPDAAEEARRKAESEARMKVPGPQAEADRRGLSDPRLITRVATLGDETASAEPDDFEPPEHCSVCGKPKSKRLGLVLSTGTHLRCKAAQVRAQAKEEVEELETDKAGLKEDLAEMKEDLAEKEAEVKHADAQIEAVTEHPEIGPSAQAVVDSVPSPESALRRRDEQAALLKEPPPRHHFGGAPDGGVLDVSPAREPGELIHLFGLQDRGAYPFGKDRPETIVALCGQKTAAKTSDLEPTVARLDTPENVPKNANCLLCVRNWSPERRVFPAWIKPSQWQDLKSATPQAEPYISPVTRTGSRARSPRAGR